MEMLRARRVAAAAALVLLLAGCAASRADPLDGLRTVHVTIRWTRFHPSLFSFPDGTTVRFVIHNTDPIDHEFIVGSAVVQFYMEHTAERVHHAPGQISVPAGTTRETTYTFGSAPLLFGCHLPGHYAYGMRGRVLVSG